MILGAVHCCQSPNKEDVRRRREKKKGKKKNGDLEKNEELWLHQIDMERPRYMIHRHC